MNEMFDACARASALQSKWDNEVLTECILTRYVCAMGVLCRIVCRRLARLSKVGLRRLCVVRISTSERVRYI